MPKWPYVECSFERRVFAPLDLPAEPLPKYGYSMIGLDRFTHHPLAVVIENATGEQHSILLPWEIAAQKAALMNRGITS